MIDTPISVASKESDATAYLQVAPTPFYLPMLAACPSNLWREWNSFTVPDTFTTIDEEYEALHTAVGMNDISPLARFRIKGPHATEYADRLLTMDVSNQSVGQNITSPMCDMHGGTLDIVELLRMAVDELWLVSEKSHLPWLLDSAMGFDVSIDDMTQNIAALRLSGPSSVDLLEDLGAQSARTLPIEQSQLERIGDVSARIIRKSGHLHPTFDLWMQAVQGQSVWSFISHRRPEAGLRPIGSAVMEMLRVEEGRIRCGAEFVSSSSFQDPSFRRTPYELGLGSKVDFDKGHFNGRQYLLARDPKFALIGLEFGENKVGSGEELKKPGTSPAVGTVLSTAWSPSLKSHIALAEIDLSTGSKSGTYGATSTSIKGLKTHRNQAVGTVKNRPFLKGG